MNKMIIISGPTATGKTKSSLELYEQLKKNNVLSEIINFDSLCFYKELKIGTAKPTKEELQQAPHHLVGTESIQSPLDASLFIKKADKALDCIWEKGAVAILVGGSGFYLRALMKGMYAENSPSLQTVKLENQPIEEVRSKLKLYDPESYENLHPNDHYRLRRAYEFFLETGKKISEAKKTIEKPYDFQDSSRLPCSFLHFYLDIEKKEHWRIIQERTNKMIKNGLIEELKDLLHHGFSPALKPLLSVGYKEVQQYLKGELKTLDELKDRINISTRQLAKSQRTFLGKVTPKETIDSTDKDSQAMMVKQALNFSIG